MMHIGPSPDPPNVGDTVQITDERSPYYRQTGVVVPAPEGGKLLYVQHDDGQVVMYPWGFQTVRRANA